MMYPRIGSTHHIFGDCVDKKMSFWDVCNTLFEKASEKMQQMQEEYENYRERYEEKDDETLIRYFNKRSCSIPERQAIASILHERGYGTDKINTEEDTKY